MFLALSGVSSTSSISTLQNKSSSNNIEGGVFGFGPLSSSTLSSIIPVGHTTFVSVSLGAVVSNGYAGQLSNSNHLVPAGDLGFGALSSGSLSSGNFLFTSVAVESYALTSVISYSTVATLQLSHTNTILGKTTTSSIGALAASRNISLSGTTSVSHLGGMIEGQVRPLTNVTSITYTNTVISNPNINISATSSSSFVGNIIEGNAKSLSADIISTSISNLTQSTLVALSGVNSKLTTTLIEFASTNTSSGIFGGGALSSGPISGIESIVLPWAIPLTSVALTGTSSNCTVGNTVYSKFANISAVSSAISIGNIHFAENVNITNSSITSSIGQLITGVPESLSSISSIGTVNKLIANITPITLSSVSSTSILGALPIMAISESINSSITSVTPLSNNVLVGNSITSIAGTLSSSISTATLSGVAATSSITSVQYDSASNVTGITSITSPAYVGFATGMTGIGFGGLSDGPIGGSASSNVTWASTTVNTVVTWHQIPKYNTNIVTPVLNVSPDDITGFGAFSYASAGSLSATILNSTGEPLAGISLIGNVGTLSILYPTLSGVSSTAIISKYTLLSPKMNERYYISARPRTTNAQVQNKYT